MKPFYERWDELGGQGEGQAFQRVDDRHPLDFYLGKDISGGWILLLVHDHQPPTSHRYQAIHMISRLRHDGRWALIFHLVRSELGKLFSHLCEDLVESSRNIHDPANAVSFVVSRFVRWQRLLERGRSGLLDPHELRGLVGELLYLEKYVLPLYGIENSVEGWVGPLGADQDFVIGNKLFEVKTIQEGSTTIKISSAEQLDCDQRELRLALVILNDSTARAGGEVFDPLELVARIRRVIEPVPAALEKYDEKLLAAGFIEREEYREYGFICNHIRAFRVTTDFPKIIRPEISQGISSVTYDIRLDACLPFEIPDIQNTG